MTSLTARQEIWRGILYGQRSMVLHLAAELKRDYGLTLAQYEALLTLSEAPELTLTSTTLGQRMLYSSGSASNLIARLEELGHVERRAGSDDARVVEVRLTDAGAELVRSATRAHLSSLREMFEPLVEDDEIDVLLRFARRLAAHEGVVSAPADIDI